MKTESLKNKIVRKLAITNDVGLLEEIYNLLNGKNVFREEAVMYSIAKKPAKSKSGKKAAALLEQLSLTGGIRSIKNPVEWQRRERRDRKII